MENPVQPFWSLLVKPGEVQKLEFPDECFLTITNACLPELPADHKTPIRLFARVYNQTDAGEKKILLTSLIPITCEHAQLNYVFSPLNDVELYIKGEGSIQLSGILQPLFDEEEEEEEIGEEEEEEIKEEEKPEETK